MKLNTKLMMMGLILTLCLNVNLATAMVDPDLAVYNTIEGLGFSETTPTVLPAAIANVTSPTDSTLASYISMLTNAMAFYTVDGTTAPTVTPLSTYYNNVSAWLTAVNNKKTALATAGTTTGGTTGGTTTGGTTGGTTTGGTTVSVDKQVVNAINAAMKLTTFASAIAALEKIITSYGTKTVSGSTQTAFAKAIMTVGGNLYSLYSKQVQSAAKKYTMTAADKTLAKQWVTATKTAYPLTQFNALLKASLKSNLLTGPQTTTGTQKNYVEKSLVPAFASTAKLNAMIVAIEKIK